MCSENGHECVLKIEMDKLLDTNKEIVGNSTAIISMVDQIFSGVHLILYGDVVHPIF